jgi:Cu2+-exporting ATPase
VALALQDAPVHDTRASNIAYEFANRLVAPTFVLGGLAYLLTGSLARAAAIVIVDFATGIRVSAPTAILATLTRAAHDGILLKGGRALEQLARADVVVFDKTGTLTLGEPEVQDIVSVDCRFSEAEVLGLAAAAEIRLRHPAARALVRHARRQEVTIPERDSSRYTTGQGVTAAVNGYTVRVGSARFLAAADVSLEQVDGVGTRLSEAGQSVTYVAVDDSLIGVIGYLDPPRPEAASVVHWLRTHGVDEVLMVTGDEPAAARAVAEPLGISRVHAGALPQDKADIVRELQGAGHVVAVIGDGINDSPALALADVSVSLAHGADLAREAADVVLMEPELGRLPHAIELSRAAMGLIRQDVALVAAPNAVAMGLATAGLLSPIGATLLSNGSTVLAAMNSLRPLNERWTSSASRAAGQAPPV